MLVLSSSAMVSGSSSTVKAQEASGGPYNWTGPYAGVNVGLSGGAFNQKWDDFGAPYASDHARSSGFSGGGQFGFNYQLPNSRFVIGLEADFQGSTLDGTYADYSASQLKFGTQVDWFGSVRARGGYAFGSILPYVTAGLSYGHLTNSYLCPNNCGIAYNETWSTTRAGWTAGGGIDFALSRNFVLDIGYLYTDLGSWRSEDPQDAVALPGEIHNQVVSGFHTVRLGLN